MYRPTEEKKDYYCPRCKAQYTIMEVLNNKNDSDFLCQRCGHALEREELVDGASTGNEKATKLANQLDKFVKMLIQIDDEIIPNNDFEAAYQRMVPVQRNQETNPRAVTVPVSVAKGPPVGVKGVTQAVAAQLDITITTSSESTAAEREAEAKRKAEMAIRNQMPEWHERSTVTGEPTLVKRDHEVLASETSFAKEEDVDIKDGVKDDDEFKAYYAQMEREREEEAREDADTDDEEEGDFEDVGVGVSAIGTPSSSMSAEPNGRQNGRLKPRESESGSSVPATAMHSPSIATVINGDNEVPPAKRMKVEDTENGIGPKEDNEKEVSDEDEEADFEDVA